MSRRIDRRLRVGAAVLVACFAAGSFAAAIASASVQAFGFDHFVHDGRVSVSGANPIECTACHKMSSKGFLVGAPDHRTCFGSCHEAPPSRPPTSQPYPTATEALPMCGACHARSALEAAARGDRVALTVHYPPYQIEHDFGLLLNHPAHVTAANGCSSCHTAKPVRARPHQRCVGCHLDPRGNVPAMSACTACHPVAYGPAANPYLKHSAIRVTNAFEHGRHQRVAPKAECLACHSGVATTPGEALPAPTAADCATCHDGSTAFSTVSTSCTRCHSQPSREPVLRPTAPPPFDHRSHLGLMTKDTALTAEAVANQCTKCHAISSSGSPIAPGQGHAPCGDSGCHADEFGAQGATICAGCHIGAEPWRPLHRDRSYTGPSQFGVAFSHANHAPRGDRACATCHPFGDRVASAGTGAGRADGHLGCGGTSCHPATGWGAPLASLAECDRCHVVATAALRPKPVSAWSVRSQFRHETHAASFAVAVACTSCHMDVEAAATTLDIAPPRKATCLGCHDGKTAFKVTGHSCSRCHGVLPTGP